MSAPNFRDVRAGLQGRAIDLCRTLLPTGRRNGNYWIAKNPTRDDRSAGSFYVWLHGPAAGGFRDDAAGEKGDCIDLVAYVRSTDKKDAFEWGKAFLGWTNAKPEQVKQQADFAQQQSRDRDLAEAHEAVQRQNAARALWLGSKPWSTGDPVDLYLRGRGIGLEGSGIAANAMRYEPLMRHTESGRDLPCIVSAMSDASGTIVAVHRVFLEGEVVGDQVKYGKAKVEPVRKIWPAFRGAVIRVNKGQGNLSPEAAEKKGLRQPVILTEGIEDGLAVAISRTDCRVWAAGSLSNLANVPRLPCVSEFIVCADNDWGKPQAQRQLDTACRALAATGVKVSVARSWIGKDANDLLKGENDVKEGCEKA